MLKLQAFNGKSCKIKAVNSGRLYFDSIKVYPRISENMLEVLYEDLKF